MQWGAASRTFTADGTPPAKPSITDTDPDSPVTDDNNPEVKGSVDAEPLAVRIYSDSDCSGSPLASGTAAQFVSPGITVNVPGDATTNLRATATDAAGNTSGCSSAFPYTEDSIPPAAFNLTSPADGATVNARPELDWQASSDSGSGLDRYEVWIDGAKAASIAADSTTYSPSADLSAGSHAWQVNALDAAGNIREAISRTFDVAPAPPPDETAPPDTTPPDLIAETPKRQKAGKPIKVKLTSDEGARASADGKVIVEEKGKRSSDRRGFKAMKRKLALKTTTAVLTAGETKTLKLRPKGSKKRSTRTLDRIENLVKRGAKANAEIRITATDAAGNTSSLTAKPTISRRAGGTEIHSTPPRILSSWMNISPFTPS